MLQRIINHSTLVRSTIHQTHTHTHRRTYTALSGVCSVHSQWRTVPVARAATNHSTHPFQLHTQHHHRALSTEIIYTQKIPKKKSSFRDRVRLYVSGGRGGSGCSSYDTDPYGRGGPDGANGGRGGDVYLVSTEQLSIFNMHTFHLSGQRGHAGGSKLSKGQNGHSLKIPIPAGTVVSEILATDPTTGEYTLKFLADMDRPGLEIKVATGGSGGLGNRAFTTKYRKQSRFSTVGQHGTSRWLYLELKCIADVGLVGYPNAGKSSFLAAISNATPEIANYPFTTLHPQVGIVDVDQFASSDSSTNTSTIATASTAASSPASTSSTSTPPSVAQHRLSVADLPGLISGASSNKGLGHEFLKHIQRTRVICYVLDLSGNDDRDPIQDFMSLQQELQLFDHTILLKPALIIANKTDNTDKHKRSWMNAKLAELSTITPLPVFPTSCLKGVGLSAVVQQLSAMVQQHARDEYEERLRQLKSEVEKEQHMRLVQEEQEKEMRLNLNQTQEEVKRLNPNTGGEVAQEKDLFVDENEQANEVDADERLDEADQLESGKKSTKKTKSKKSKKMKST